MEYSHYMPTSITLSSFEFNKAIYTIRVAIVIFYCTFSPCVKNGEVVFVFTKNIFVGYHLLNLYP